MAVRSAVQMILVPHTAIPGRGIDGQTKESRALLDSSVDQRAVGEAANGRLGQEECRLPTEQHN
jgi:hypothetical protein